MAVPDRGSGDAPSGSAQFALRAGNTRLLVAALTVGEPEAFPHGSVQLGRVKALDRLVVGRRRGSPGTRQSSDPRHSH
jgi:hypothetical protein